MLSLLNNGKMLTNKEVFSMQTVSLKSNSPDTLIPLLRNAIDREKRILTESLRMTKEKVKKLSGNLGVDTDRLMRGEIEHTEANEMQLIELEGEIEILRQPSGAPRLILHKRAMKEAKEKKLSNFEVSISHERDFAIAIVVGIGA